MSDPLELAQKHVLLKNGIFDFELDNFKQGTCICSHSITDHLDCNSICLSKESCICERFLDKDAKITISPQKQHKIPHKEERKERLEDSQIAALAKI